MLFKVHSVRRQMNGSRSWMPLKPWENFVKLEKKKRNSFNININVLFIIRSFVIIIFAVAFVFDVDFLGLIFAFNFFHWIYNLLMVTLCIRKRKLTPAYMDFSHKLYVCYHLNNLIHIEKFKWYLCHRHQSVSYTLCLYNVYHNIISRIN